VASFVTGYLRPALKRGAVDLWIDRRMPGGADWEQEIAQKLGACDMFILLVSRHSLSSDYVVDKEIPIIRARQANGDAVHPYPLVLTPTPEVALDIVRNWNLRPRDWKPLSDYPPHERYRHMNEAADEIAEIAGEIAGRKAKAANDPIGVLADDSSAHAELIVQDGKEIRIILGTGEPFESEEPAGTNKRRFVRVKLQNDSKVQVGNCKLGIVNLEPPSRDASGREVSECALKTDILLGPGSEIFAEVAYFDIGSPTALRSNHIRLAVPFRGGFFAEAYAYANLPLSPHAFDLRLSRFSEVYDEIRCLLNLDADGVLKLENQRVPDRTLSRSGTSIAAPPLPDPKNRNPQIDDPNSLLIWLNTQSREAAVVIAARAALRVSPLVVHAVQGLLSPDLERAVAQLTGAVLRAAALARFVAKHPNRAGEFRNAADAANRVVLLVSQAAGHSAAALGATKAAMATAISIFAVASNNAANAANAALDATVGVSSTKLVWEEIQADVSALEKLGAGALGDFPLWSRNIPQWANYAWAELRALLPEGENWEVWIDWYEERLRGGSHGEDYELVFASVPQEEWDKGSAAANAWIRDHLPLPDDLRQASEPKIADPDSLEAWLRGQSQEVAIL
jgi:hypothetical protein